MCKDGFDGETAAKAFYEQCFSFFGLPSEILSDNDVWLASSFFQTLCALSGVEQKTATAYHPESNGRAEAAVKAVVNICWRTLLELGRDWVDNFPTATFLLNSLPGVTSEFSPHQVVFGRDPVYFGDSPDIHSPSVSIEAESWIENLKTKRIFIAKKLSEIHAAETALYNSQHPPPQQFREGDRVLVRLRDLERHKLDPVWFGPCEILKWLHTDTYRVNTPNGTRDEVFANLKEYFEFKGKQRALHYYLPKKHTDKSEYTVPDGVVDHIVNHKGKGKKLQFRVRWRDFGENDDTWEPLSHFLPGMSQDLVEYTQKKQVALKLKDITINSVNSDYWSWLKSATPVVN